MSIDKTIRKQHKSYKRFMFSSCFIFFILIFVLFYFDMHIVLKVFIVLLEVNTFFSIIKNYKRKYFKYKVQNNRVSIKVSLNGSKIFFKCNDLLIVHTKTYSNDFKVIFIIMSKIKKSKYKSVNKKFLNKYSELKQHYEEIRQKFGDVNYYYVIFNKRGAEKYKLLNDVYTRCFNAVFTDDAINRVRIYRK